MYIVQSDSNNLKSIAFDVGQIKRSKNWETEDRRTGRFVFNSYTFGLSALIRNSLHLIISSYILLKNV